MRSKRTRVLFGGTLAAALLAIAGAAAAVDVRGSLRVRGAVEAPQVEAVRGPYWREWNGFIEPRKQAASLSREAAVVLIGQKGASDATTVALLNGQLAPRTIVMQQGTALRIRNRDDFTHKLHAEGLEAFDAIETSPGQGRQLQIDEAGTFAIRDELAPHVSGTLIVLPKVSAVAKVQDNGEFVFEGVDPGEYQLKVFRDGKEVRSLAVTLTDDKKLNLDPIDLPIAGK